MSRVRAALEGSRELRFAGGRTVTPPVELGVRHDSGDAETGTGLGTGFGVVHADPNLGPMVDAALSLPRAIRARRAPARSPGIACPRRGSMYPSLEERQ